MTPTFETKKEAEKYIEEEVWCGAWPHRTTSLDEEYVISTHKPGCGCGLCPILRDGYFQ